jgi:hypothetical protein
VDFDILQRALPVEAGALFLVSRKPRHSGGVPKRLTDEKKSSKYDIISSTCQSKLKNIFGGFIYEKCTHRQ